MLFSWFDRIGVAAILAVLSLSCAWGDATEPAKEQPVDASVQAIADGDNAFALNLYGQLRAAPGNLFFSPYSVDDALMMLRAGANGATADEITKTLGLPDLNAPELGTALAALAARFDAAAEDKGYQLHVANAMWGQNGMSFLPAYIEQLQKNFAADLNAVDFHNAPAAADTINQWVAKKTNDRIKKLISAGLISEQTRLILTNAIYFKGDWSQPFKKQSTHDAPWNDGTPREANPTTQPTVSMMSQSGDFDYAEEGGLAALQMPYVGKDLAMLVLLPHDPAGLDGLEKSLDAPRLKEIVGKLRPEHQVQVSFPKFKLETQYELSQTLAKMGMPTVFSEQADLSGIDGRRDLSVSGVIHKAFVQVDESGTEAAAATGVMIRALAFRQRTAFVADHPFMFVIRDIRTGTILFIGRVVQPG